MSDPYHQDPILPPFLRFAYRSCGIARMKTFVRLMIAFVTLIGVWLLAPSRSTPAVRRHVAVSFSGLETNKAQQVNALFTVTNGSGSRLRMDGTLLSQTGVTSAVIGQSISARAQSILRLPVQPGAQAGKMEVCFYQEMGGLEALHFGCREFLRAHQWPQRFVRPGPFNVASEEAKW